jgi:hypothetical protein
MSVSPLVAESGRTALGLARALGSDDPTQTQAAINLIMTMPRKELEGVAATLASLFAGLALTSGLDWDDINAEMEKRIAR